MMMMESGLVTVSLDGDDDHDSNHSNNSNIYLPSMQPQ